MSFPRYPKYKDSGVEWLGEVPEHWEVKPVKNLASIVNGYPFDSKLFDAALGSPLIRIRDLNQSESETFYKGEFVERAAITSDDVLIGMDGDFNVGRWLGEGRALLNQRMCCVRGSTELHTRLLEYALPIPLKAINEITYSTTVKHLASSQVEKTFVAIPPTGDEQIAIAAFLDRETAKIDGLVAEQRRLMELLKEKRQAVISHAVTKGLNPAAPMKPSGIEWLGDVPEHWTPKLMKFDLDLVTSGSRGWAQYFSDDGELFFRITNIQRGHLEPDLSEPQYVTPPDGAEGERSRIRVGDVLISITADLGSVTVAPESLLGAYVSQHVCLARPGANLCPRWVGYALKADCSKVQFEASGYGGTKIQLSLGDVRNIQVALPPMPEQEAIAVRLDDECGKFDTLTTEAQRAIDLLQERRTALISAAVTGQIDVRHLANGEEAA